MGANGGPRERLGCRPSRHGAGLRCSTLALGRMKPKAIAMVLLLAVVHFALTCGLIELMESSMTETGIKMPYVFIFMTGIGVSISTFPVVFGLDAFHVHYTNVLYPCAINSLLCSLILYALFSRDNCS